VALPVKYDNYPSVSPEAQAQDMFDFASILNTIVNAVILHRVLVAITVVVVLLAAAVYQYAWPPVYTAEAVIMVERQEDAERDSFYKEWNLFRKNDARTEIELMKSGTVLTRLIAKEQLRYDDV